MLGYYSSTRTLHISDLLLSHHLSPHTSTNLYASSLPHYRSTLTSLSLSLILAKARADSQAIQHRHPYEDVRDTALYYPLRKLPNVKVSNEGQYPSLKTLCREVLGMKEGEFQKGEHCPVSLARRSRAVMRIRTDSRSKTLELQ